MKTYNHLWDGFVSEGNIEFAVRRALRNKRKSREIRDFLANRAEVTAQVRQSLIDGTFKTATYRSKIVHEPKRREILILPFAPDRIVHHALMNILTPIWDAMFCSDSYACRPGYGIKGASDRCMQFVRKNKYYLQCDVRKFYPTMHHETMFNIIRRKIKDKKILAILRDILKSVDGETGLPIGNFCSQWFGNLYLNELDTFVKHELRAKNYLRYCDDFCLFSNDKKELGIWQEKIRLFMLEKLHLTFSFSEISTVKNGVDFLGYRHFPKFVKIRKTTLRRIKRRLKKLLAIPKAVRDADLHIRCQIGSMHGWTKHASTNLGNIMKRFD